jgi:hypothetical protein
VVAREPRRSEPHAVGAANPARDHEQVGRRLLELLVALDVQRVHRRFPDDLVDADQPAGRADEETVELETVEMSIGPLNGIEMRGWMLNPPSSFNTSTSAQSLGRTAQSGFGRLTRRPVACVRSLSVCRLAPH